MIWQQVILCVRYYFLKIVFVGPCGSGRKNFGADVVEGLNNKKNFRSRVTTIFFQECLTRAGGGMVYLTPPRSTSKNLFFFNLVWV